MRGPPPALILLAGIAAGSCMDGTIKFLALSNSVLLVTLGRYLFGGVFSLIPWLHAGRPAITRDMLKAHFWRGVVVASCSVGFFWGLTVLPLAEAVTLSFIYPLIVPFIAKVMIGESIRPTSIVAALIGFAGVIVATQGAPSAETSPLHGYGVAAVLYSTVMFSVAMVMLRDRAQKDGPAIVGLLSSLMPGLLLVAPTLLFARPPDLNDWWGFLLMGGFAAVFMYLIARAYAGAEAQQLAPIHYTELLWASVIGYVVFHETPRVQIYAGALLIVAACLYVAYEERKLTAKAKEAA
ncbi:DMT family transporter [Terricaulis sp.]|uniref:DMT family transporter n=1 Tax=Terricaulis sp. TaxID=2768686 RepID=UPI003783B36F